MSECTLRKITIGVSGLPNLVLTGGGDRNWCLRSLENRKRNNERTAYGTPKSLGNRSYRPTLRWLIENAYVSYSELTLLEQYIIVHQANPATLFTIQDENDRLNTSMGSWHNKTIVPDSTITEGGLSRAFYSCVAYLDLLQDQYYEVTGANLVSLRGWGFMEVATN